jgi:hypothetical protein
MRNLALLIEVLDEALRLLPPTIPTFTKLKMYDAPILNLRGKKQMTTFTSDDREEAYKKIVAKAPNQPGYEDAVPIPFVGWVNTSPPHIVDSGASVMIKELTDEEIYEIGNDFVDGANDKRGYSEFDRIGFARAILRKAQEK